MPKGIIVMQWGDRSGAEVVGKFPKAVELEQKTLMQIYAAHDYEEQAGIVSMMVGPLNLLSYYMGEESGVFVILVLDLEEEGDVFEDALIDAGPLVLESMAHGTLDIILSGLFNRVSIYPGLEREQLEALVFLSKPKRMILNRLLKDGHVTKGELNIWLKEKLGDAFVSLDNDVMRLIKYGLVKQGTVKGLPTEVVYLMNAMYACRQPCKPVYEQPETRGMPAQFVEQYRNEVASAFRSYRPSEHDAQVICELLTDPQVYEVLKLMRMSVVTKDTLEKLRKKGVEDVNGTLQKMDDAGLITRLQDEKQNITYYALKADVQVRKLFPKFIVNLARQAHNDKTKSDKVLIEHLKLLKDAYYESLKVSK